MVGGLHVYTEVRGQLSYLHLFMGSGGQTQAHRLAQLLTPLYGFWGGAVKLRLQACTASTFTCLAILPVSTVLSSPVGGGGDLPSYSLFPLSLAPNMCTHTIWSHSLNWLCEYSMPRIGSKFSLLLNWSSAFRCLVY